MQGRITLFVLVLSLAVGACNDEQVIPTSPTTHENNNTNTSTNTNNNSVTVIIIIPPGSGGTPVPIPPNSPNPPPGGNLQLPTYTEGVVRGIAAANPTLVAQSCVTTFGPSGYRFLDLVVDTLRLQDARFGYVCRDPSCGEVGGDVISYWPSAGIPTVGSTGVIVVDIIESYCLTPNVGFLNQGFQASARWSNRGRF